MSIGKLSAAAVVALAVGFTGSAVVAETIKVGRNDPGVIATFDFSDMDREIDISATIRFALDEVLNDIWKFTVTVANTSTNIGDVKNRISSFGFDVRPIDGITLSDDDNERWSGVDVGPVGGAGYQFFDLNACVRSGNVCTGSGGGVVGQETSVLGLDIESASEHLFFGDFATRWQEVGTKGKDSIVIGGTVAPIPLPPVGFMLLGALGALAFAARRRQVEKV